MGYGFWGTPINVASLPTNPSDSDVSTKDTVMQMIALAREYANNPLVMSAINSCLMNLSSKPTHREIARAIYQFVKKRMKFVEDEEILANQMGQTNLFQELLISPPVLLSMPQAEGDCDDYSTLIGCMLVGCQIPCWYTTIAVDKEQPFRFSHVYVTCWLGDENRPIAMDASHGDMLGWEQKKYYRRADWRIN